MNHSTTMQGPLHPEEIKARLRMKWGTMRDFARAYGLDESGPTRVLIGTPWKKVAQAIATELDIPLHMVSDHYYRKHMERVARPKAAVLHRLNGKAA